MTYKNYFKDKRITLMGLGLLGRGVGDAKFLAEHCKELIVTDLKSKEELKSSLVQLKKYSNITYRLSEHNLEDFQGRDLIVKSAGVPLQTIYTDEATKNGIPITMSTSLFTKFAPVTTIGITGTKGKSTTTHLIHHVLRATGMNVHLGGNVLGVSTLAMLPIVTTGDIVVLELDSWQLQGFHAEKLSPHIAVFTNFMEDHMNYYNGDMDAYFYDKSAIFSYQSKHDTLIATKDIITIAKKLNIQIAAKLKLSCNTQNQTKHTLPFLPGDHNQKNAEQAHLALQTLGVPESEITKHFATATALPGRLELVASKNSIDFYNDTNATIPDATITSLATLTAMKKDITLITGGTFKDVDVTKYAKLLPNFVTKLILLEGSGTNKLLETGITIPYTTHNSLSEAFNEAVKNTTQDKNNTILLSPAFSSFGMFKNEYDRGAQFNALVKNYLSAQ